MARMIARIRNVVLAGCVGGVAVYLIIFGFRFDAEHLIISLAIGCVYAGTIWTVQEGTLQWIDRRLPLKTRRDILIRAVSAAIALTVSFVAATLFLDLTLNVNIVQGSTLFIVGFVAFTVSAAVTGLYYLDRFHTKAREAEWQRSEAEFRALRAQIDPHFLFNALNSVSALISERPADADDVVTSLADLYRYSLRTSHSPTVRLGEEVEAARTYLAIERIRFEDRLTTRFDVPEQLIGLSVPNFILQPLVENAVKHGLGTSLKPCTIGIKARRTGSMLRITVCDTGRGFETTDRHRVLTSGTGLANVFNRVRILYGNQGDMIIHKNAVELVLPIAGS